MASSEQSKALRSDTQPQSKSLSGIVPRTLTSVTCLFYQYQDAHTLIVLESVPPLE